MFSHKQAERRHSALSKRNSISVRIRRLENAIKLAQCYLDTGANADWHGFRPLFVDKWKDGKPCPPHRDWVRNVFIRRCQRQIASARKSMKRLELENHLEI